MVRFKSRTGFDDVRHVDPVECVAFQRPGEFVQIPNDVGGGSWRNVDPDRLRFSLSYPATDIQNRLR
jgi:hypothetical protein